MNKKLLTVITTLALSVTSVATPYRVFAEDIDSQIEKAKNQVESLTNKLGEAEKELAAVSAQIADAEEKSSQLQQAMTQTQEELTTLTKDIADLEEVIAKRTVKLQTQARAKQTENTLENYLGVILSSRSIVDAIERFNAISALVTSGAEMREQQVRDKESVETKKAEVEQKLIEQSKNAKELSDLQNDLSVKKAEREVYVASIALEKSTAEKDKAGLEAKREEAIRKAEAAKKAEEERIAKMKVAQEQAAAQQVMFRNATAAQQAGQGVGTATASQQSITSSADVSISGTSSEKGSAIAAAAVAQLGIAQDCTRLATNALKAVGINYHGWPIGYMSLGTVVSASEAQPGDLIYYANGGMGLAHIAVYIGNGKAVHGGWNGNSTVVNTAYVGSGPVFIRVR